MNQYREHVERKLAQVAETYPNVILAGTEDEILKLLDKGLFANEFRNMYRTITDGQTCEDCGTHGYKGAELERCHTRPRPSIAREAIQLSQGILHTYSSRAIMTNFIRLHLDHPVRILCPACHRNFDQRDVTFHYHVRHAAPAFPSPSPSQTTESSHEDHSPEMSEE